MKITEIDFNADTIYKVKIGGQYYLVTSDAGELIFIDDENPSAVKGEYVNDVFPLRKYANSDFVPKEIIVDFKTMIEDVMSRKGARYERIKKTPENNKIEIYSDSVTNEIYFSKFTSETRIFIISDKNNDFGRWKKVQ